jgi:hypothetical protein
MRWCCVSLLLVLAIGYSLGAMTEPPKPREGVVCQIVEWIAWVRKVRREEVPYVPQSFQAVPQHHNGGEENGQQKIDHYGSL